MNNIIPVIDLNNFLSDEDNCRNEFVAQLGSAFQTVGFVSIKNHGIPTGFIDELYNDVQYFFSLPLEKKLQYEKAEIAGQRGYTSFGREHAKGSDAPDQKEFFQYGQTLKNENLSEEQKKEYPPNVIVKEVPALNSTLYKEYRYFEKAGSTLLKAIAIYLDIPQNYFEQYLKNGNSILRYIHYPPITQEPKSAIRAEQHEDINLITLLVGASADGLQILTRQNEWINVTSLPDQIVVNVGDMLQRLRNNKLKSTTHRVVNPPRELWHTSRFSMPFFLHPRSEMNLACLKECIDKRHPKAYNDITAAEYLDERLKEIGLKK